MNTDILGEIICYLNIKEDKSILTSCQLIFNLTDNEKTQILRTWENNSKYECRVFGDRKEWYVNGRLHREADKPAIEHENGSKEWWVNGKRHRDADKPAVEYADGRKEWWVNDRLIRSSY